MGAFGIDFEISVSFHLIRPSPPLDVLKYRFNQKFLREFLETSIKKIIFNEKRQFYKSKSRIYQYVSLRLLTVE